MRLYSEEGLAQCFADIVITFMPAVIAHVLAQQATADTHRNFMEMFIHLYFSEDWGLDRPAFLL